MEETIHDGDCGGMGGGEGICTTSALDDRRQLATKERGEGQALGGRGSLKQGEGNHEVGIIGDLLENKGSSIPDLKHMLRLALIKQWVAESSAERAR